MNRSSLTALCAVAVVGGYRDEAGRAVPLSAEEYLAAVRRAAKECPELAQTLARSVGAAVLAMEMQARGHRVTLTSVEGCRHRIGPFLMTGHELVATIWAKIVRPHFALPPQRTGGDSCCTVEESRLVLDVALQGPAGDQKFVQCVTTSYHIRRADAALPAKLRQAGAPVHAQAVRNPDNNKLQEMRYEMAVDFAFGVTVTPEHDSASLLFKVMNLDGFETITLDFSALEVGSTRLDELAKWLLGEPHQFFAGARNLRRVEA